MSRNALLGSLRFDEMLDVIQVPQRSKIPQNVLKGFEKVSLRKSKNVPEESEMFSNVLNKFRKIKFGFMRFFKVLEGSMMFHRTTQSSSLPQGTTYLDEVP